MSMQTWWLFVMMTFVVSATPGPNMLLVMTTAAQNGLRYALACMAGCMTALILMLSLSAAGLGALLEAWPRVFDALRLAGAAYLAYLGIQVWRAPVTEGGAPAAARDWKGPNTLASQYRRGVMVAASNPKAILFAAAFFPQFINPHAAQLPQFVILLATFSVIEVAWYFVYAASGKQLSRFLQRATFMRNFNRATGGVFVGFAGLMALKG